MLTQSVKQQEDSMKEKWEALGATEHSKDCNGRLNLVHPKILAKLPNIQEHKIRKLLEKNNLETKIEYKKTIKVLNRGRGTIVNTNSWKPLFRKVTWCAMLMA